MTTKPHLPSAADMEGLEAYQQAAGQQHGEGGSVGNGVAEGLPATLEGGEAAAEQGVQGLQGVHAEAEPDPRQERFNTLWARVNDAATPAEFQAWTSLLSAAEQLGDIARLRDAYDAFLAEWPLCFGYWKKYAAAELRAGEAERAAQVFERGVAAVPYSVDMWAYYCTHRLNAGAGQEEMEGLYERALAYVGTDYFAHAVWDKYVAYEHGISHGLAVAALYSRALGLPLRDLERYRREFLAYTKDRSAAELASPEEIAEIRAELEGALRAALEAAAAKKAAAAGAGVATANGPVAPAANGSLAAAAPAEGEAAPMETEQQQQQQQQGPAGGGGGGGDAEMADVAAAAAAGGEGAAAGAAGAAAPVPEISDADIKKQWLARREEVYKAGKAELARRYPYESGLRRPYFHVKPLDPTQLATWARYLEFSEGLGDHAASVRLYERCMVACANYPEYWMRYVRYLDAHGEAERAEDALRRASSIYCKRSPQLFLFAARRAELGAAGAGGLAAARSHFERVGGQLAPGLVQCTVQRANFERRHGSSEAACRLFEEHLAAAAGELAAAVAAEQQQQQQQAGAGGGGSNGSSAAEGAAAAKAATYGFLVNQYAHFLHAVLGQPQRAQQAYADALARAPQCRELWEGAVHLETVLRGEGFVGRVLDLYDRATAPPAKPSAAAPAASAAATAQEPQANGTAAGGSGAESGPGSPAAAGGGEGQAAAAAAAPGLPDSAREELSERMLAFADLHGSAEDLRRAEALHSQRFPVPLALANQAKAAGSEGAANGHGWGGGSGGGKGKKGGASPAAHGAHAAPAADGTAVAAAAAAHAAAAAAAHVPPAAMDYYGSAAYYGAPYGGYTGYYGPGYYGY